MSHRLYTPHNHRPSSITRTGCPNAWVGDKVCDARCNTPECAWDAGDCGVGLVLGRVRGEKRERGREGVCVSWLMCGG